MIEIGEVLEFTSGIFSEAMVAEKTICLLFVGGIQLKCELTNDKAKEWEFVKKIMSNMQNEQIYC